MVCGLGMVMLHIVTCQVLEIALPSGSAAEQEENAGTCGICYSYYTDAGGGREAPDVNCDNGPCGRPYHRSCLVEWLRGVSDTRQSFNILFGQCVYCSAPLSVKMTGDGSG